MNEESAIRHLPWREVAIDHRERTSELAGALGPMLREIRNSCVRCDAKGCARLVSVIRTNNGHISRLCSDHSERRRSAVPISEKQRRINAAFK